MNVFITKNGQQLGPYTLDQIHSLVNAGTFQANDWAWYEGLADWVPLNHIPGFSTYQPSSYAGRDAPASTPLKRPVLVWIISIFCFICTPLALLFYLVEVPLILSGTLPVDENVRKQVESLGTFEYGLGILSIVLNLAGGILLLLMRRAALYCFIATFLIGILNFFYQIVFKNWIGSVDANPITLVVAVVIIVVCYLIQIAVLAYVWYLFAAKRLR
jgi:hypothetical protein